MYMVELSMLVDGIIGSTRPDDARWLGFPKGFEAVVTILDNK